MSLVSPAVILLSPLPSLSLLRRNGERSELSGKLDSLSGMGDFAFHQLHDLCFENRGLRRTCILSGEKISVG
jgi:hypothetical protein